jgi:hypothetical protein
MSARHAFNQCEVLTMRFCKRDQDEIWKQFEDLAEAFDFKVRVTGGAFLTHEITCTAGEFQTMLEVLH